MATSADADENPVTMTDVQLMMRMFVESNQRRDAEQHQHRDDMEMQRIESARNLEALRIESARSLEAQQRESARQFEELFVRLAALAPRPSLAATLVPSSRATSPARSPSPVLTPRVPSPTPVRPVPVAATTPMSIASTPPMSTVTLDPFPLATVESTSRNYQSFLRSTKDLLFANGPKDEVLNWLSRFERAGRVHGVSSSEVVRALPMFVSAQASSFFLNNYR